MMESFTPNCTTKRYNQFRPSRKKKDKFVPMEIDTDENKGRRYKLERFLRDCIKHLPSQELLEASEDPAPEGETAPEVHKRRKTRHVKLPVLNESKGIFENVIIGRSAKKAVEKFAEVTTTPEDRARLQEDIHALARVGPDSELSFEMIPPTQQPDDLRGTQSNHVDALRDKRDTGDRDALRDLTPVVQDAPYLSEQPEESPNGLALQAGSSEEDLNKLTPSRSGGDSAQNEEFNTQQDFFQEAVSPSIVNDSGFKDTGSQREDKSEQAASHHCECCQRRSSREKSFFDADAILKSNETGTNEGRNVGRSINEIFSNHQARRSAELKDWSYPGSPLNLVGSTYPSRSFHLPGIEIQSRAVSQNDCGDVYCESRPKEFRSSRVSTTATDFNKKLPPISRSMSRSALHCTLLSTVDPLQQINSTYNKFRYDRSLSPRKY